jgi:hypothetical protein
VREAEAGKRSSEDHGLCPHRKRANEGLGNGRGLQRVYKALIEI